MNDSQPEPSAHPASPPGVLDRALALIEFLRANCSWDAAQTHSSLRRYLLEEAHEVVDAIEAGDDDELRGELGDLLLNLAFQVVIAEERGAFDREGVVAQLEDKMRRRHPHLYGGEPVAWETLKARERGGRPGDSGGMLADLIAGSDALAHAHRIQARVSEVGFDWSEPRGAWEKVREEVEEVGEELGDASPERLEEEVGDLLFAVVNLARLCRVTPSLALSRANLKFARRFGRLERLASERGIILEEAGLAALDSLWDDVKKEEL